MAYDQSLILLVIVGKCTHTTDSEDAQRKKKFLASKEISSALCDSEEARNLIGHIKYDTEELRNLYMVKLSWPSNNEKTEKEIKMKVEQIKYNVKCVHKILQHMKHDLEHVGDKDSAAARIQLTQYETIKKLLVEAFQNYNMVLQNHRDKYAQLIQQQLEISDRAYSPEEAEQLIQSGSIAVFVDNYIHDTKEARRMLNDVKSRHEELKKLEKNIEDVKDMFLQLALLVEAQGEALDRVEYHVTNAGKDTDKGNIQLMKAKKKKKKKRKRCSCLIVAGVIIIVIFVLVIVLSFL